MPLLIKRHSLLITIFLNYCTKICFVKKYLYICQCVVKKSAINFKKKVTTNTFSFISIYKLLIYSIS